MEFLDVFYFFLVNFMSWWACGLYLMRQCFFEAPKAKMFISYCFLQHFGAVGTSRKGICFRQFSVFVVEFMSRWASGLHSMRECFFESQNEHIHSVLFFFSIFELWGLLDKVTFLDVFRLFSSLHTKILFLLCFFYSTSALWAYFENVFVCVFLLFL